LFISSAAGKETFRPASNFIGRGGGAIEVKFAGSVRPRAERQRHWTGKKFLPVRKTFPIAEVRNCRIGVFRKIRIALAI
jgi:hypothetical protein